MASGGGGALPLRWSCFAWAGSGRAVTGRDCGCSWHRIGERWPAKRLRKGLASDRPRLLGMLDHAGAWCRAEAAHMPEFNAKGRNGPPRPGPSKACRTAALKIDAVTEPLMQEH